MHQKHLDCKSHGTAPGNMSEQTGDELVGSASAVFGVYLWVFTLFECFCAVCTSGDNPLPGWAGVDSLVFQDWLLQSHGLAIDLPASTSDLAKRPGTHHCHSWLSKTSESPSSPLHSDSWTSSDNLTTPSEGLAVNLFTPEMAAPSNHSGQ